MQTVLVMMSTYNGEKYIREQINSIINQNNVNVKLLIRDDGSKDSTLQILEEYSNFENVSVIYGDNIGADKSFFTLIQQASEASYYAFADQDDRWDSDKLFVGVNSLMGYISKPALYSSNTRLVDKDLKFIKNEEDNPLLTLESALIKNFCTGCTIVFNNALMMQLKRYFPKNAVMHDWWVNLIVLAVGGVSIYDVTPHMSYRQHGNNVSGAEISKLAKAKNRIRKFFKKKYGRDLMAQEIITEYGDVITPDSKQVLEDFGTINKRLLYKSNYRTNSFLDTILFRICVFFKRI